MPNWVDVSEIVTGLVLDKRLACNSVNSKSLIPPYDSLLDEYKKTGDIGILIEKIGLDPVQSAIHAAETVNGTSKLANWIAMLDRAKHNHIAGEQLEKISHKLQSGDSVDWSKVTSLAQKANEGVGNGLTPLSEVTAMEVPFKKTGFKAIDKHFGGLPEIGQVLLAGSPGTGKTSFMLALAVSWVKEHPNESVIIFTLEMMKEELKMRLLELSSKITNEEMSRIYVEEIAESPEETISVSAGLENVGLVCLDFADLLIGGETSESKMSHIYTTYMLGAKSLRCTILVIGQLNGYYQGGIPRPYHVRYSRLAEALAWAIIMLYNPSENWYTDSADDDILPPIKNHAYVIGWKFRGGFRVHKHDHPGAIQLGFNGENGWDYVKSEGVWFPVKDQRPRRLTKS